MLDTRLRAGVTRKSNCCKKLVTSERHGFNKWPSACCRGELGNRPQRERSACADSCLPFVLAETLSLYRSLLLQLRRGVRGNPCEKGPSTVRFCWVSCLRGT